MAICAHNEAREDVLDYTINVSQGQTHRETNKEFAGPSARSGFIVSIILRESQNIIPNWQKPLIELELPFCSRQNMSSSLMFIFGQQRNSLLAFLQGPRYSCVCKSNAAAFTVNPAFTEFSSPSCYGHCLLSHLSFTKPSCYDIQQGDTLIQTSTVHFLLQTAAVLRGFRNRCFAACLPDEILSTEGVKGEPGGSFCMQIRFCTIERCLLHQSTDRLGTAFPFTFTVLTRFQLEILIHISPISLLAI